MRLRSLHAAAAACILFIQPAIAQNAIVIENALPGNPPAEWDVVGAGDPGIQGFATDISYNAGETVEFKVGTPATDYRLDIYRMGYYGGDGARLITTIQPSASLPQAQPACTSEPATGLVDCGNWAVSAAWTIPGIAVSGIYFAKLVREDGTPGSSHIVFVVRDDASSSDLLFQTSDTTWQAYNGYGGNSLYTGTTPGYPQGHAVKVSYNRPFLTRAGGAGGGAEEDWVFNAEYPMVRWLERNGYDVSYFTNVDTDRHGDLIPNHQVFLSVGHDEYWSKAARDKVEAARAAGVHLAFFSGNEVYWKVRWEDGHRTLVAYKEGSLGENACGSKCDPLPGVWTGLWRSGCAPEYATDACLPENALSGQISWADATGSIQVPADYAPLRFWRDTDIAALTPGATATLPFGTLGYEWNPLQPQYADSDPPGLIRLSRTDLAGETHQLTLYRHASGALVFGAGTVQWSWGLDSNHARGNEPEDARMQQATVNLFADMGVQPATLQVGLVAATASSDVVRPASSISVPAAGASLPLAPTTISGTASDVGGVVAGVEVSVDGGTTWRPATGLTNWTFAWAPAAAGPATLQVRAVDDSGNLQSPVDSVQVNVDSSPTVCPCRLWDDSFSLPDYSDSSSVELGLKFRADIDGYVTAIRFHRGTNVAGTHIGNLWASDGTNLASVIFTGETPSGWQEATFAAPVPIVANTTYIASYFAPNGNYSFSDNYFAVERYVPPLRALQSGADGPNGVYKYGPASAFPTDTFNAANYWVDVVFTTTPPGPDVTPPTVVAVAPADGSSGVAIGAVVTATFNEPVDALTVGSATFTLRDAGSTLVPATVTYDAATRRATLDPAAALAYSTTYTATLTGGSDGIEDLAGNALAVDRTWSFTTAAEPPLPPAEGPGGPVLVISSVANPFSRYYAEILRAEGLNAFTVTDIGLVTPTLLAEHDLVILGEFGLTPAQVALLADWVNAGGNLIAMRPDKQLAAMLGLADAAATLSEGYLLIDTASSPGTGLVGETIQFHGSADRYTLAGATSLATLYVDASTATASPAVTLNAYGSGQAAAFTYDLARSVVYTRQGNPAWAGQKRDGQQEPIRSDDLFFGNAAFDPQPDWIDFAKVAIPQADEQQRLLANLILQMNRTKKPLPRFWYLPRGEKAAVVMTHDDHGGGDIVGRLNYYNAQSPASCSVAHWECVRSSTYMYTSSQINDTQVASYQAQGHEFGIHLNTGCARWTPLSLANDFALQIPQFLSVFPSSAPQTTHRTHCISWSDWATQPQVELLNGIRLDTNYYYWPGAWIQNRPGLFTGSGMPMRFADLDGTPIDVYQATTQLTDESGQTYPFNVDALLDRALGSEGYYGVFTTNLHTDGGGNATQNAEATVQSALARGVPVIAANQLLAWLDGRNASSFGALAWNTGTLTFTINLGAGADGAQAMLPVASAIGPLVGITRGGSPVGYATQAIKGIVYAVFDAQPGAYAAVYAADTTPPAISGLAATSGESGTTATVVWTTDEPAASAVNYGTSPAALTLSASDPVLRTAHGFSLSGLTPGTTYYFQVTSVDGQGNGSTAPAAPASFVTPAGALSDQSPGDFAAGTGSCYAQGLGGSGGVTLAAALLADFSGSSLPAEWVSNLWSGSGSVVVGGGAVTVDASDIGSVQTFAGGTSLEFVATFSGQPFQHVGFVANLAFAEPWIIFSTGTNGGALYARIQGQQDVLIAGNWLNAPHRFRIEWNTGQVVFEIDGATVSTQTAGVPPGPLVLVASDFTAGGGALAVDWLRASAYASPCQFTSRVLDAGTTVNWSTMAWTAQTPPGTTLGMSYRIGDTPAPDGSWSAFAAVTPSGAALSGSSRYLQYRADLATADAAQTPALQAVSIDYSLPAVQPPSITSGPTGQTVLAGEAATLAVTATGTQPLAYQWYQGASGDTSAPVPGATAATLLTPALTETSYFWVRVSNVAGQVDSTTASVVVLVVPAIQTQPQSQSVTPGGTAELSVVATGTPPLSYQWYRGESGDTSTPILGGNASSFTTPALETAAAYWVRVGNAAGSTDSNTAYLAVAAQVPTLQPWGLLLLAVAALAIARQRGRRSV